MLRMKEGLFVCCLGATSLGASAITITPETPWVIRSLGTLGGSFSSAADLNNAGQVVGSAQTAPRILDPADPPLPAVRAFISAPNGGALNEIATLGGFFGEATAVNQAGRVVGTTTVGRSLPSAFVTGPNGAGIAATRNFSRPNDINNVGQTVFKDVGSPLLNPDDTFFANNNGSNPAQITTPDDAPGQAATAVALNDRGQVAVNGANFGYLWTRVEARNLTPGARSSRVVDINEAGQVLGVLVTDQMVEQVFLTAPNGGPLTPVGTPSSINANNDPTGLNNLGDFVGRAEFGGLLHGYVRGAGGMDLIDLETLDAVVRAGWRDLSPVAINDLGQIAGTGIIDGQQRAFLLTPVPEPETYLLLVAGLGLLGLVRLRAVRR